MPFKARGSGNYASSYITFLLFLTFCISQGIVATCLRCDGAYNKYFFCKFIAESDSERIVKIGHHLRTLCLRIEFHIFDSIFGNNYGKPQPIRTKFGIHARVKGLQRSALFPPNSERCITAMCKWPHEQKSEPEVNSQRATTACSRER